MSSASEQTSEAFLPAIAAAPSRARIMSPQSTTLGLRDDNGACPTGAAAPTARRIAFDAECGRFCVVLAPALASLACARRIRARSRFEQVCGWRQLAFSGGGVQGGSDGQQRAGACVRACFCWAACMHHAPQGVSLHQRPLCSRIEFHSLTSPSLVMYSYVLRGAGAAAAPHFPRRNPATDARARRRIPPPEPHQGTRSQQQEFHYNQARWTSVAAARGWGSGEAAG